METTGRSAAAHGHQDPHGALAGQRAQEMDFNDFNDIRNAGQSATWLAKLKQTVVGDGNGSVNVFAVLVDAVRHCALGQVTTALNALYGVGGQYRRNM